MGVSDTHIAASGIEDPATMWNNLRQMGGAGAPCTTLLSPPKTSMSRYQRMGRIDQSSITDLTEFYALTGNAVIPAKTGIHVETPATKFPR